MATILSHIMNSKSVAIIGVSSDPNKAASPILSNMLDFGFEGKVYPVNPRLDSVMGLPVSASVKDIEGQVDLAIISTPPKTVPGILMIVWGYLNTWRRKNENTETKKSNPYNRNRQGKNGQKSAEKGIPVRQFICSWWFVAQDKHS